MQLAEDLFVVGGGAFNGFGLSTSADCHVYAVDAGDAILLIDCGMDDRGGLDAIFTNMAGHGLDPELITHVAITHYHIDHCGGISSLIERTGAQVVASRETVAAIRAGDVESTGFALAQAGGVYPEHYVFEAVEDLAGITAAGPVTVGSKQVTAIPAPGHCAGHQVYLVEGSAGRYLFTGDCVFHGGKIALLNTPDCSLDLYRSTIEKLAQLDFDALLPGHAAVTMTGGPAHIALAADAFQTLLLPPNFV